MSASQSNCPNYNKRSNDKTYDHTMYLGAYQNKYPFVNYDQPNPGTPVAVSAQYPAIAVSSMLKGYYSNDGVNPNPNSSNSGETKTESMAKAYGKGGCLANTDKTKFLNENTCHLDKNGSCANSGDAMCQSNAEVLPGMGSLMTAESSRNLFPMSQYKGMTIDRFEQWKMDAPLQDTNMYSVTSTRNDAKKELEQLALFKKQMKQSLEEKKAAILKKQQESNKKKLMASLEEKVSHYKANAEEQTKNQEAYYRSVVQANIAQQIQKEKNNLDAKTQQFKQKNQQLLNQQAKEIMLQGEQQLQQLYTDAQAATANKVSSYMNSNMLKGQQQLQQQNNQLSSELDYKIDDILFSEFDEVESRLKQGISFEYNPVSNLQKEEANNIYPYWIGESKQNPAVNNF